MGLRFLFFFLFVFACLSATGQQNADATRPAGEELTAPVLQPSQPTVSTPKHCDELDGVVKFAGVIDTAGLPQELKTVEASDSRLIGFATEVVEAQRFRPGTLDGTPTAVAVELTVGLHTCAQPEKHPTNGDFYQFTLRAHPLIALSVAASQSAQENVSAAPAQVATAEQVGGKISAPIPVVLPDPAIPVSGKLPKHGICVLGVTIDTNGVPQNIHVVRGLEPELDSYVVEAAKSWRFKPALRDGRAPVAVEGTVVGMFEYVEKEPVAFASFIPETPEKVLLANANHEKQHFTLELMNGDEVIARYMPSSHIAGRCVVSLMIDTNGVPQNVHIVKGLDSSVDMDTVTMVEHLRFKPILKDGTTPVPIEIIMPVRYRVAIDKPTWRDLFFNLAMLPVLILR
jgi:TonB family protein